jgi:predicted N-acetyltransferase YhbS
VSFEIRNYDIEDIPAVKQFTDQWIGEGYFSEQELKDIFKLSQGNGMNASYLAFQGEELAAVRLSLAPGEWVKTMRGLNPKKWGVPDSQVGYFKSLFVAEKFQRQGPGRGLSQKSLLTLKDMGAQAVVCHC